MAMIQAWQVYFIYNCRLTDPPKDKFVIITCFNPNPCGFFINTELTQFTKNSPRLRPCHILIAAIEHPFLQYDSWVDCQDVKSFQEAELFSLRGTVSASTKQAVLNAVEICPVLRRRFKNLIK